MNPSKIAPVLVKKKKKCSVAWQGWRSEVYLPVFWRGPACWRMETCQVRRGTPLLQQQPWQCSLPTPFLWGEDRYRWGCYQKLHSNDQDGENNLHTGPVSWLPLICFLNQAHGSSPIKHKEKKKNKSHSYQGQWAQILVEQFLYPNHSTKPSVSVESKFWRCQETSLDTNLSLTLQILHKHSENFKFFHAHQSKWPKRAENLRRRSRKESGVFIPHKDKRGMIRRYRGTQGSALTGHTGDK